MTKRKRKPKVYVSGAITGVEEHSKEWRTEWCKRLKKLNFKVFDPQLHDKEHETIDEDIVIKDIKEISVSDIVIINADCHSWGSGMELVYARIYGVPVYTIIEHTDDAPIWLKFHSKRMFETLDDFVTWWYTVGSQREDSFRP